MDKMLQMLHLVTNQAGKTDKQKKINSQNGYCIQKNVATLQLEMYYETLVLIAKIKNTLKLRRNMKDTMDGIIIQQSRI